MNETSPDRAEEGKESNASTKDERETSAGPKALAVKNKQCPYCSQTFTSSSLGRHLDQYLYKKKPDGVHNVEEIKQLRSGITRRTARGGTKQGSPEVTSGSASASASAAAAASAAGPDPHSAAPLQLNSSGPGGKGYRLFINQPTWHSTGVINDIPNSSPVSQLRIPSTSLEKANRLTSSGSTETTKALELALREVLDSVKAAASSHIPSLSPFDFDLQSQTFPALCLQALPHPPSLFSTHPFPSPNSFPIEPPTVSQREIVQQALRAQILQWKYDQLAAINSPNQGPSASTSPHQTKPSAGDAGAVEKIAYQHEEMTLRHLELSLQHWMELSSTAQRELWHLEIVRAFAREAEKRKTIEAQLHRTQQEANQLRAQVEKLASCQWPREFAIFPPNLLPISPDVARELDQHDSRINSPESSKWDYDNLVAKWQRVVMHDRSMGRSGVGGLDNTNTEVSTPHGTAHRPYSTRMASPLQRSNPLPPPVATSPKPHQPYQQRHHPQSPAKHSPHHESREANETTDHFRPPKRPRQIEDQPPPRFSSPGGSSSPRYAWSHPPVHESSTAPQNRSNSVLSPTLPRGPMFPIGSATPPTPPGTGNLARAAGPGDSSTRPHRLSNASGPTDGNTSERVEASPKTQYTPQEPGTREPH
ncbi:uncharacterized protein GIQ15_03680 [Arthroderma uncinatum]|uniref:uncharacterized protein n=1 Tax=Arthroderma uncinatum TaxID=74035 RepID=UPI00144ACEB5|nr:uncharacterized protein GIQ15_03680 [Arthroderma uncinatum]KAF3484356.1 hypothetical protein GIQ15_03680 [Arthroderma uncinatum]